MDTNNVPFIAVGDVILPNKPLSNFELIQTAENLKIPDFRGVFLRDTIPKKPKRNECGILNLDTSGGSGTHWVAWFKKGLDKYYFDSYGIQPPIELIQYLHCTQSPILYNTEQVQQSDQVFCRHLCLYVLQQLSQKKDLQEIINYLY